MFIRKDQYIGGLKFLMITEEAFLLKKKADTLIIICKNHQAYKRW